MLVLLANVAAVLFMAGLIWTMQFVHYPLFDRGGVEAFPAYETAHNRLFFLVAGPGVLLLFARPPQVPLWAALLGLVLFAVISASTALLQAPQHGILSRGFDRGAYEFVLRTNWIRTAAWSAYGLLCLWMVWRTTS
ncbi:MAG: hypothetical protein CYG60_12930 [Actinobacteria bacterium]|nr:hypothetical protein [Actinomycetota bacterium]PLS85391.1 MAG: hypothetical protein CYG60_12930 [Actinomycetota bacterium]